VNLIADKLEYSWRHRQVLSGVSLSLAPGEVIALLGANGAGKSTLLRLLLGLLKPAKGEVLLGDRPIASWQSREIARQMAYVPQMHVTPFPYTVREVVMLGRLPAGSLFRAPSRQDRDVVETVLDRMGIRHLAERAYSEISGGERQLSIIARALAQGARLLVMDEPATGLDYGHQLRLLERLASLAAEGYGVLMTTHHPDQALIASTRVLLMRDGRIEEDGPPHQVVTAENIHRLYGVRVHVLQTADGQGVAFRPMVKETARSP